VGTTTLGERAAAILRDEIEHGALANITAASQVWSAHHRDLLTPKVTRRLAAEFGGLLDTVLDLLTPPPRSAADSPLPPAAARLRNDGPTPAEVGFVWSDLVAEPGGRIHAGCLRLLPSRVRIPAGACVDLAIGLEVPDDARPGLYHALLQATERMGLRALLTFPVGLEC
jgi:hypothetical protein